MSQVTTTRSDCVFLPDPRRVITKPFIPGNEGFMEEEDRLSVVVRRVLSLPEDEVAGQLTSVLESFAHRHQDIEAIFESNFQRVQECIADVEALSRERRLLTGAYFTHEYSIEAAALTNPSIVLAPDQSGLAAGSQRFVLSLRAIGEGHISSVEFRSLTIDSEAQVTAEKVSAFAATGEYKSSSASNYQLSFSDASALSERVIYPHSEAEKKGVEDARFVRFEHQGLVTYYATYTAYSGTKILPQLIETVDFQHFKVRALQGRFAKNKGMALFPRKIGGHYVSLSRHDGESSFLLRSKDLYTWDASETLQTPKEPWELLKIGNAGSPIETSEGWLVLTHAVGPMRRYVLSAILLDLADPSKIIGRLRDPLFEPGKEERDGYVPNVLYTCGATVHGNMLVLPYGFSDMGCRVGMVPMDELLAALKNQR